MTGDFSVFPSELTMLCGTSSWLTQVTVVPAGTVSVSGAKLKLSILIWYWSIEPFWSPAAGLAWLAFDKPKDRTSKAAADALTSAFFIFLYTPIGYWVLRTSDSRAGLRQRRIDDGEGMLACHVVDAR